MRQQDTMWQRCCQSQYFRSYGRCLASLMTDT